MKKTVWIPLLLSGFLFLISGWQLNREENREIVLNRFDKPNFIVIYTDDQRFDGIGVNNNQIIKTPNIDRMAKKGLQFSNANVVFSLCSPSRAALLTGRYGSSNGVLNLGSGLNEGERTVADYLRRNGYSTALSGKWHIKQKPDAVGFDWYSYFFGNGPYYSRKTFELSDTLYPKEHIDLYSVKKSIAFLEAHTASKKPFFLFHCPQTPHMNDRLVWDAKDSTKATYNVAQMPVPKSRKEELADKPVYLKTVRNLTKAKDYGYPDSLAIQNHTLDYYSVISEMDSFLGKLFDKVEELGLLKNTFIIFMSDNGWMLGEHGFTSKVLPYKPSTHVPFWIVGPNVAPGKNNSLVSNLDIFPTILDLAKLKVPKNIHGISLLPILEDNTKNVRDHLIYEGLGLYGGTKPNISVLTDKFRYIRTYEDSELEKVIFEELYDQNADSDEIKNLIGNHDLQSVLQALNQKIDSYQQHILDKEK